MTDYHIDIFDSAELEAGSPFGTTPEEPPAEVERAGAAWMASAREAEKRIPAPRYRPVISQVRG